jgi:hypothetical protein
MKKCIESLLAITVAISLAASCRSGDLEQGRQQKQPSLEERTKAADYGLGLPRGYIFTPSDSTPIVTNYLVKIEKLTPMAQALGLPVEVIAIDGRTPDGYRLKVSAWLSYYTLNRQKVILNAAQQSEILHCLKPGVQINVPSCAVRKWPVTPEVDSALIKAGTPIEGIPNIPTVIKHVDTH